MNCENVRGLLSDRRDGALDAETARAVDTHLETCDACRREHEALGLTLAGLRALRGQSAPREVKERVLQNIRNSMAVPRPRWRPAGLLVRIAAVLVISVIAGLFWHSQVGEQDFKPEMTAETAPSPSAEAPKAVAMPRDAELYDDAPVAMADEGDDALAAAVEMPAAPSPTAEAGPEALRHLMLKESAPASASAMKADEAGVASIAMIDSEKSQTPGANVDFKSVDKLQDRRDPDANLLAAERLEEKEAGAALPVMAKGASGGAALNRNAALPETGTADGAPAEVQVFRVPENARQQTGEFIAQLLIAPAEAPAALASRKREIVEKQAKAETARAADAAPVPAEPPAPALDEIIALTRSQFAQLTAFLRQVQVPETRPDADGEMAAQEPAAEADAEAEIRQEAAEPEPFFDLQIQITE